MQLLLKTMHMNDLVPKSDKQDALTRILRFYTDADITLTPKEEEIMRRWQFCDSRIRERKYREETVVQMLMDAFGISKTTATNDY
jgi:hypothetical protein